MTTEAGSRRISQHVALQSSSSCKTSLVNSFHTHSIKVKMSRNLSICRHLLLVLLLSLLCNISCEIIGNNPPSIFSSLKELKEELRESLSLSGE